MPLFFFFDIDDGTATARDEVGIDCADPHQAVREAEKGLAGIVRDAVPFDVRRCFTAVIRDASQRPFHKVAITVESDRISEA